MDKPTNPGRRRLLYALAAAPLILVGLGVAFLSVASPWNDCVDFNKTFQSTPKAYWFCLKHGSTWGDPEPASSHASNYDVDGLARVDFPCSRPKREDKAGEDSSLPAYQLGQVTTDVRHSCLDTLNKDYDDVATFGVSAVTYAPAAFDTSTSSKCQRSRGTVTEPLHATVMGGREVIVEKCSLEDGKIVQYWMNVTDTANYRTFTIMSDGIIDPALKADLRQRQDLFAASFKLN